MPAPLLIYADACVLLLGLGVSMARSCVINTIFFSSFEWIKKHINALPDPVIEPVE